MTDETPPEGTPEEADRSEQERAAEQAAAAAVPVGPDDAVQATESPAAEAAGEGAEPGPDAQDATPEPVAEAAAPAEDAPPEPVAEAAPGGDDEAPRARPAIPGMDLEVDIVEEGADPLARENDGELTAEERAAEEDLADQPIAAAAIDLAADARYRATGKRKTAVARVILRPGDGSYTINGKPLDTVFPRPTLQRTIRQPLETVGYESRMDVVARLHGGGVSAQAGALRHGISRALLEADPNLRGELKRRGFLTRDARAKERKKAGLKKARKRPQFSKR